MLQPIQSEPCPRCGLEVNVRQSHCHHCEKVSNLEAVFLRKNYKGQIHKLNIGLRRIFMILTLLVGAIVVWLFIR